MSFQLLACQTVLLLACRAPTAPVPDTNLSRVSLAFVLENAGFRNALVLTKTVPLSPFDTEILTRDWLVESGVVAVKEAVRDLLVSSRKRLPIDTAVIRALGAKPIARSPGADSFVGPRAPRLFTYQRPAIVPIPHSPSCIGGITAGPCAPELILQSSVETRQESGRESGPRGSGFRDAAA